MNTKVNPRLKTLFCVVCGKQLTRHQYPSGKWSKPKVCSDVCLSELISRQARVQHEKSFKQREYAFAKQFEEFHPNFKYHSGYVNSEGMFKSECRVCGHVQERSCQAGRPKKANTEIQCDNCNQIKKTAKNKEAGRRRNFKAIKTCLYCGKEFEVSYKNNFQKYCSRECEYESYLIKRVEVRRNGFVSELKICKCCGRGFYTQYKGSKIYCSDGCRRRHENHVGDIRRRHKLRKNGRVDYSITVDKLIERDKNICHICGGRCDKGDHTVTGDGHFVAGELYPSIDHVVPVSKGGTHTNNNVKLAHMKCNVIKSDRIMYKNYGDQLIMEI